MGALFRLVRYLPDTLLKPHLKFTARPPKRIGVKIEVIVDQVEYIVRIPSVRSDMEVVGLKIIKEL